MTKLISANTCFPKLFYLSDYKLSKLEQWKFIYSSERNKNTGVEIKKTRELILSIKPVFLTFLCFTISAFWAAGAHDAEAQKLFWFWLLQSRTHLLTLNEGSAHFLHCIMPEASRSLPAWCIPSCGAIECNKTFVRVKIQPRLCVCVCVHAITCGSQKAVFLKKEEKNQ